MEEFLKFKHEEGEEQVSRSLKLFGIFEVHCSDDSFARLLFLFTPDFCPAHVCKLLLILNLNPCDTQAVLTKLQGKELILKQQTLVTVANRMSNLACCLREAFVQPADPADDSSMQAHTSESLDALRAMAKLWHLSAQYVLVLPPESVTGKSAGRRKETNGDGSTFAKTGAW